MSVGRWLRSPTLNEHDRWEGEGFGTSPQQSRSPSPAADRLLSDAVGERSRFLESDRQYSTEPVSIPSFEQSVAASRSGEKVIDPSLGWTMASTGQSGNDSDLGVEEGVAWCGRGRSVAPEDINAVFGSVDAPPKRSHDNMDSQVAAMLDDSSGDASRCVRACVCACACMCI